MARRPGYRKVRIQDLEHIVSKERQGLADDYRTLSDVRLELRTSLAPVEQRYQLEVTDKNAPWRFTHHALSQLAGMAGVPMPFLERAPSPIGLRAMRCMLDMRDGDNGRQLLFRLKAQGTPVIRGILSASTVRVSDVDVARDIVRSVGQPCWIGNLNITDDVFTLRLLFDGTKHNLGSPSSPDPSVSGIDVISSETGRYRLQIRTVLVRLVCTNGMTSLVAGPRKFRSTTANLDRERFRHCLREAIASSLDGATEQVERLRQARTEFVGSPKHEIERIFKRYRLGRFRGEPGRWVRGELNRSRSLFGVDRFSVLQAFTAVARGLDHDKRRDWEDAMSDYLAEPPRAA